MTTFQDLCPLDVSPEDQPGTMTLEYAHLVEAVRKYLVLELGAVPRVAAHVLKERPGVPAPTAWEAARYSVMSTVLFKAAGFPPPNTPEVAHLIPGPGTPMGWLLGQLLQAAEAHQVLRALQEGPADV